MMTFEQIRAVRGLLGWSARELSMRAGVHLFAVERLERNSGPVNGHFLTIRKIQQAFENSGIIFFENRSRWKCA